MIYKYQHIKAIPAALHNAADTLGVYLPKLAELDAFLAKLVEDDKHQFIGMRVLRRGQLIFNGTYGAQTPGGEPLFEDAIYPMQSVTKTFTATCAAILQERGAFSYWDTVQHWFPEFHGDGKEGVALWHCLCHTTGMSDGKINEYAETFWDGICGGYPWKITDDRDKYREFLDKARDALGLPQPDDPNSDDDVSRTLYMSAPLEFKPGSTYNYVSFSYELIRDLIERCSGQTLEQFARENIFGPLGMSDSCWHLPEELRPRFARRLPEDKGGEYLNSVHMMESTSPTGGLKSSLADLERFAQMFLQGGTINGIRILSPASVRLMTKDMNEKLPPSQWLGRELSSSWGLGWDVKNGKIDDLGMLRSERSYNHCGFGGARLLVDPDAELVVSMYMCEKRPESFNDDMGNFTNILYSSLD
jgi:CubicO group peptidase (beta-lactamase class C family)